MGPDSNRRSKSGITSSSPQKIGVGPRPKTEWSKKTSHWISRSGPFVDHVQSPRIGSTTRVIKPEETLPNPAEKNEDLTDSTEFTGLSDDDDPDPEILDQFLRSGTDPSCPISFQVLSGIVFLRPDIDSEPSKSLHLQRAKLWKAKTEALRRVKLLLGDNEDLLQSDPHWRDQEAQAIKDDIRTYMDLHEDTAQQQVPAAMPAARSNVFTSSFCPASTGLFQPRAELGLKCPDTAAACRAGPLSSFRCAGPHQVLMSRTRRIARGPPLCGFTHNLQSACGLRSG